MRVLAARMVLLDICSKDLTADPKRVCGGELSVVLLNEQPSGVVKIDCERRDMFRI